MTDNIKLPPMPKPHTPPVFATAANTPSVKAGYELGGYEKTPPLFDEHQLEAYACEAVRLNAQAVPDEWGREVWRTKLENLISEYGGERATEAYHGGHFCKRNPTAIRKEIAAMLSAAPQPAQPLTDEQIKRIMLDNGFTIKEGLTDLKPYIYAAARALIAAATGVKND